MSEQAYTPTCDYCGKLMEPTVALAFFYPQLRDKPEAFKWACRFCRIVQTEPVPVLHAD